MQEVAEEAAAADPRLLGLLQRALLVGTSAEEAAEEAAEAAEEEKAAEEAQAEKGAAPPAETDFLIRQVLGADNDGGLYVGERLAVGTTRLQFHGALGTGCMVHGAWCMEQGTGYRVHDA